MTDFGPSVTVLDNSSITGAVLIPVSKSGARNEITVANLFGAGTSGDLVSFASDGRPIDSGILASSVILPSSSPTMTGVWTFSPATRSSGAAPYLTINAPADTTQTASTNRIGVNFVGATVQHATGALAVQTDYVFGAMTHTAVGATTIAGLTSVFIPSPIPSTNVTATWTWSLMAGGAISAGTNNFGYSYMFNNQLTGTGIYYSGGIMFEANNAQQAFLIASINSIQVRENSVISWCSAGFSTTLFTGLSQNAQGVVEVNNGTKGTYRWLVTAGAQRVPSDVTNATATPAPITGASFTAIAGRKYGGYFLVFANNSVAAEGLAFNFAGTATITDIKFGFVATPVGTTVGTPYSNAAATPITVTTATTGDIAYMIAFEFVCNAAGTVLLQGAEVSHVTGTATFRGGSFFSIHDSPT